LNVISLSAIVGDVVEADVDLGLAAGADLVVLDLDGDAEGLELALISERRSW
jgi:hypothetical protein